MAADAPAERLKIGDDLFVVMVDIDSLREQDINAQILQPRKFDRLTENIRLRGQVESLPYVHQSDPGDPMEIISGHHRARAAKQAGVTKIPVVLDTRKMRKSEVVAKQIAHNELTGTSDEQVLKQMLESIDNVDDLLTTGLPEDFLPTVDPDDSKLLMPHAEFDWRIVTLTFLPADLEKFDEALASIDQHSEIVGVARRDQFGPFAKAAHSYGLANNVRSMSTTIALLTDLAHREIISEEGYDPSPLDWSPTTALVGQTIPSEAAKVVLSAITQMIERGEITHPWQFLEAAAAEYLAGP